MNKEVIKAMNRKEKKSSIRQWWKEHGYIVLRVVLFPLWITCIAWGAISQWLDSRNRWSVKRVDKILQYYIPRASGWNSTDKCFYFSDNGMGWNLGLAKRYLKRRDYRFWHLHNGLFGGKIREYLVDEFELEGFVKEVENRYDDWTIITFRMIEK